MPRVERGVDAAQSTRETVVMAMTLPNKITVFRILLVPFFVAQVLYYVKGAGELHRYLALSSFALAAISDGIDGFIARRFNQRSELGSILDPLADKMLLVSGIILLSLHHEQYLPHLPLWFTTTVISRDVLLVVGAVVIHYVGGRVIVKPHWLGKVATVLQMTCVFWALLKLPTLLLGLWALAAAATTAGSGVIYILAGLHQLSASPASSAAKTP